MKTLFLIFGLSASLASAAPSPSGWLYSFASSLNWTEEIDADGCNNIIRSDIDSSYPSDPSSQLKYISYRAFSADVSRDDTKNVLTSIPIVQSDIKFITPWQSAHGLVERIMYSTDTLPYVFAVTLASRLDDSGQATQTFVCVAILAIRNLK